MGTSKWREGGSGDRSTVIYKKAQQSVYDWINKSIHHHPHSTARRAKYAAHAKYAEQGAEHLRREHHDSTALGRVAKVAH